jgi:hypothetical protein
MESNPTTQKIINLFLFQEAKRLPAIKNIKKDQERREGDGISGLQVWGECFKASPATRKI